jgi:hypothetical protein
MPVYPGAQRIIAESLIDPTPGRNTGFPEVSGVAENDRGDDWPHKNHTISSAGCYLLTLKQLSSNLAIRPRLHQRPHRACANGVAAVPQVPQYQAGF